MNTYTKEQREAWDKVVGPGKYTIEGERAYHYLCNRIKGLVSDPTDPHTVLVIGSDEDKMTLFQKMADEGVIDAAVCHQPLFFGYEDYPADEEDDFLTSRSCWSEEDTDQFCDFIRHAKTKTYHHVAAVVLLNQDELHLALGKVLVFARRSGVASFAQFQIWIAVRALVSAGLCG